MTVRDLALRLLAVFTVFNIAIIFAPTTPYGLLFVLLLSAAVLLLDFRNGLLMAGSALVLVLFLEAFVRLSGDSGITPYYRAHEILAEETRYRPNQRIEMTESHGDLLAIDPRLDRALAEPKEMVFETDARGFRNADRATAGGLLIIGDSLVVGIANTQADTLTAQLASRFGIAAYNMGFPAGPFQYANTVAAARAELGAETCIVVVMFEGNDFQIIDPAELAARSAVPRAVQQSIKAYFEAVKAPFELAKVFFGLYSQAIERLRAMAEDSSLPGDAESDVTFTRHVAGAPMVFLKGYADVVQRTKYQDFDYILDQFAPAVPDLFVFVPDKFRVYAGLLDEEPVASLPQAQLEHLSDVASALAVPLLDLTEALQDRSRSLLPQGEVTYWRDDTHWNRLGIEIAAGQIAESLMEHDKAPCRAAVDDSSGGVGRLAERL